MNKTTSSLQREAQQRATNLQRRLQQLQQFRRQFYRADSGNLPYRNLAAFFHTQRAPLQSFVIDNNNDNSLTGEQGTIIQINKNNLLHIDNQLINGKINLELREVITKADMIFSNLPTTSEDRLLEFGGAVFLSFHQSYLPLRLQKPVQISLPLPSTVSNPVALRKFRETQINQQTLNTFSANWQKTTNNGGIHLYLKDKQVYQKFKIRKEQWNATAYLYRPMGGQRIIINVRPTNLPADLEEMKAFISFNQINCVAQMYFHRGQFMFYNIPTHHPVTIIIIGKSKQQFYYSQSSLNSVSNETQYLPLQAVEEEELIAQINAL